MKTEFIFKWVPYAQCTLGLAANVWFPEHARQSKHHIALYFHGGGYVVGSKDDIPPLHVALLLELGFVVVSPNYRLCPTISAVEGPVKDCMDCYLWAQEELPKLMHSLTGIEVDPEKIVTIGGSCGGGLTHLMSGVAKPPAAIVDFAGMKYLSDPFHSSPSEQLQGMPEFDPEYTEEIWSEVPPPVAIPWPFRHDGPPDCSRPRYCWRFKEGMEGTHYQSICPRGDTSSIDPAMAFSRPGHPPTCLVNRTADQLADVQFAKRAHSDIMAGGAECELLLAEVQDHGFEFDVQRGEPGFEMVERAFHFAAKHVGLL